MEHGGDLTPLEHRYILRLRVDGTNQVDAVRRILAWARDRQSRSVCVATTHVVMEAYDSAEFRQVVNWADLVTPDGMPLVWGLRWLGIKGATRVCGPDLMPEVLEAAAAAGIPVGFFGGTPVVMERLVAAAAKGFPGLKVAFAESPPFRPLADAEDRDYVASINRSGARILFVGLGCPKQERWMAAHRGRVKSVMLGVGAAFDFLAGTKPRAPRWMQQAGLEWLFRLATEPRRLWRRYAWHNPRFAFHFGLQLMRHAVSARSTARRAEKEQFSVLREPD